MIEPSLARVTDVLAAHAPMYRWHRPAYQHVMLARLAAVWDPACRRVLDVGGGTGVMAQAVRELLPVDEVISLDVANRFLPTLTVRTAVYDGRSVPFRDGAFDCVVLFNVLHHVPPEARSGLMRECARVSNGGPIYIKDHVSTGRLDDVRLTVLDLMGNLPSGGMLRADYLRQADWTALAATIGYEVELQHQDEYRAGLFALLCPNRLETLMVWRPSGQRSRLAEVEGVVRR